MYVAELISANAGNPHRAREGCGIAPIPRFFPRCGHGTALSTPNADIVKAVESAREKLLAGYSCFDVFTDPSGEKLPADRKSIAYTFLYRDPAKTLTAAEVDAAHQRVLKVLADKVKGLSFR